MLPGHDALSAGDIVEECQGMEVTAGCDGLPMCLEHVFLLLNERKVAANSTKCLHLTELAFLAIGLHNDYDYSPIHYIS